MPPTSPKRRHSAASPPGAVGKGKQKATDNRASMGPPTTSSKGSKSKTQGKTAAEIAAEDAEKLSKVKADIASRRSHVVANKSASGTPFTERPPSVSAKSAASRGEGSVSTASAKVPKRSYRQRGRATSKVETASSPPEISPRDAFLKLLALDCSHGLQPAEVEMMCHGMEVVIEMKSVYLATITAQIAVSREQCRLLKLLKSDPDKSNKVVYLDSLKSFMIHQSQLDAIVSSTANGCTEIDRRIGDLIEEINIQPVSAEQAQENESEDE